MNQADSRLLAKFLDSPDRPDGTLRFHELQGFLFAVASSPETIAPSEWMPMIGNDQSLVFADENEAKQILGQIMAMYNEVNTAVLERSNTLPVGCTFDEDIRKNFEDASSISQWSNGFATGHDWLVEVWDEYLVGELDEECGASFMVLSFFASMELANAYYAEMAPGKRKNGDASFEDLAKTVHKMFPDALASYANLGRTIFEAALGHRIDSRNPAVSNKVGRNEPCPCGSGKKYKRCCGGAVH